MVANDNESHAAFSGSWTGRREGRAAIRSGLFLALLSAPVSAYFGFVPPWVGIGAPILISAVAGLKAANDN